MNPQTMKVTANVHIFDIGAIVSHFNKTSTCFLQSPILHEELVNCLDQGRPLVITEVDTVRLAGDQTLMDVVKCCRCLRMANSRQKLMVSIDNPGSVTKYLAMQDTSSSCRLVAKRLSAALHSGKELMCTLL